MLSAVAATLGIFGCAGSVIAIRELLKPVTLRLEAEVFRTFIELNVMITAALFLALFIGGVGGLARRARARRWLLVWSIANLCWMGLKCAGRAWIDVVDHERVVATRNLLEQAGVNTTGMTTANLIGIDIALIALISAAMSVLPICILKFWRQTNVVRAFANTELRKAGKT